MAKATIIITFDPGTDIESAFKEAIRLATVLNVWCEFIFNGVICLKDESGSVDKGVKEYNCNLESKKGLKIALANLPLTPVKK